MRALSLFAGLVAVSALAANPAYACKGGTETFNINFNDEDSLTQNDAFTYSNGKAVVKPPKGKIAWAFNPDQIDSDIDLCVTFKTLKEAANPAAALIFWTSDKDMYLAMVSTKTGQAQIYILAKQWRDGSASKKVEYKKGADNILRVVLKGNEGTASLNDKEFVKFKRKEALDSFNVGIGFQDGEFEVSKFAGTSVD
jgi:hypothetical protein